jgi:hypothetical protein
MTDTIDHQNGHQPAAVEPPKERKQRQPRADQPADTTNPNRVKLTDDAKAALAELRTLIGFSGEDEAVVLSKHIIKERDNRVALLKKNAAS